MRLLKGCYVGTILGAYNNTASLNNDTRIEQDLLPLDKINYRRKIYNKYLIIERAESIWYTRQSQESKPKLTLNLFQAHQQYTISFSCLFVYLFIDLVISTARTNEPILPSHIAAIINTYNHDKMSSAVA